MHQIITCDLDGTLLTSNYNISNYTRNILKKIINKETIFVISTGRNFADTWKIKNQLNIQAFMITCNGAEIYNNDGKKIYNNNIKTDITLQLSQMFYLKQDIITHIYFKNKWYTNKNIDTNLKLLNSFSIKNQLYTKNFFKNKNAEKIFFTSNNYSQLKIIQSYLQKKFKNKITTTFSKKNCLEINKNKVSKGTALIFLLKKLNLSLNNCIAFGDGMNDKDMLSISGNSFIMKNGDIELKKSLPDVPIIGSNNEDAVAYCLYNTFIKNKKICK
ncbi:Pyridoxal phosphate phosphatase YigL [Buchnera aphidicola (Thelaxes suberi)]|uniref:Cof-type HAD-IIB family hydrolase n=1 Tax=Buchnera aphidicola TaxID=9 RepID=UPI0034640694